MPTEFKPIDIRSARLDAIKLIGEDWMLVTAGDPSSWNTMTASWGGLGVLWNRPAAFVFVRPSRHTYGFLEKSRLFTLSFFAQSFRPALEYCGRYSGREKDKAAGTGLSPFSLMEGTVSFKEASLVHVCRRLYSDDISPERFIEPSVIGECYHEGDYHRMYVGAIEACFSR